MHLYYMHGYSDVSFRWRCMVTVMVYSTNNQVTNNYCTSLSCQIWLLAWTTLLQGNPTSKYQGVLHAIKSIQKQEGTRAFWSVIHMASTSCTPTSLLWHKWKCWDGVGVRTKYGIIHTEYDMNTIAIQLPCSLTFPLSSFWLLAVCKIRVHFITWMLSVST